MTDENQQKDNFWLYVACVAVLAIGSILMVKQSETEKFDPIRQRVAEEISLMNIRVLK